MAEFIVSDGNFSLHRAWSAIGKRSAQPTVRVPLLMLEWFCSHAVRLGCSGGAIAFDGSENFRYDVYSGYKSNRGGISVTIESGPMGGLTLHDAVYASLKPAKELFKSLGIRVIHLKKFEADDVMISAAWVLARNKPQNHVYLDTNDKDMIQGITENVSIYHAEMLNRPEEILTLKTMPKMKHGLSPKQFLDLQILLGDGVDSIPAVPGIEKAEAIRMLKTHGRLSDFLKTPKGKEFYYARATELHRNKELVMMSKKAFPYVEKDLSFKYLTGEAECRSFVELRNSQRRRTLF